MMKFMDLLIVACGDKAYAALAEHAKTLPGDLVEITYEGQDKKFGEVVDKATVTEDDAAIRCFSKTQCIYTVETIWNLQHKST